MKTKFFTSLIMGFLLLSAQTSQSQNVLIDGSFDTTKAIYPYCCETAPLNMWNSFKNVGTDANATVVGGVCNYQIINAGAASWEVQLEQLGFPLLQGHTYHFQFDVKADADRWYGLYLGEYYGNWTPYLGWENYWQYATTVWQTMNFDFKATCNFDINKLSFELGGFNIGMNFDNISIVDLGEYTPSVGIIGTSLPGGWNVDEDMLTTDGINYTLSNFLLMSGSVKFRQDNVWCVNWGDYTFPTGTGYQDGPNIPVLSYGKYDITFNRVTGEYSFLCVNDCPAAIGIIGTAVPPNYGADPDANMSTNDGINYFIKGVMFSAGEAKFRQDDSWDINWGGTGFPTGTATMGGPGIPVTAGPYDVTFNIVTGEYKFSYVLIGVIGDALLGWDTDVDMQTTDGLNYTLLEYPFNDGLAKFRLDNSWDINWGGNTFPKGFLIFYGPVIPVPAGTYTVTFSLETGEYNFVATTCPVPGIRCPENINTGNSPGLCGAYVDYPEVIAEYNCGGAGITIEQTAGLASGEFFPLGTTTNTFVLTNAEGNTATCSFDVVVYDSEPPVISGIGDQLSSLWPANHKMVPIHLNYNTSDNCGGAVVSELFISSNEPENGLGDGDTSPDWKIIDNHNILLRAERSGKGTGRVYTITIISRDNLYNSSSKLVTVSVPHNKSNFKIADVSDEIVNQAVISKINGNGQLKVKTWPNPSTLNFNMQVESLSDQPVNIYVSDILGRRIKNLKSVSNQTIYFGDDLQPGMYVIEVRQGNNSKIIKMVKQK